MGRCAFNMSFIFLFGTASSIPLSPIGSGSLVPCGFQHDLYSTAPVSPRHKPLLRTSECSGSVRVLRTTRTMLLWWEAEWAGRWMWACVFSMCMWCCPCSAVLHYIDAIATENEFTIWEYKNLSIPQMGSRAFTLILVAVPCMYVHTQAMGFLSLQLGSTSDLDLLNKRQNFNWKCGWTNPVQVNEGWKS